MKPCWVKLVRMKVIRVSKYEATDDQPEDPTSDPLAVNVDNPQSRSRQRLCDLDLRQAKWCQGCGLVCADKSLLQQHLLEDKECYNLCQDPEPGVNAVCLRCEKCDMGFYTTDSAKALADHTSEMHGLSNRINFCALCGKSFYHPQLLRIHLDEMHKDVPKKLRKTTKSIRADEIWQCALCEYRITRIALFKNNIEKHMKKVHKLWHCAICDLQFRTQKLLKDHKNIEHNGEPNPETTSIPKALDTTSQITLILSQKGNMPTAKRTKPIGTNNQKQKIDQKLISLSRQKSAKIISARKKHLHEGYRIWQCNNCELQTSTRDLLRLHRTEQHSNIKSISTKFRESNVLQATSKVKLCNKRQGLKLEHRKTIGTNNKKQKIDQKLISLSRQKSAKIISSSKKRLRKEHRIWQCDICELQTNTRDFLRLHKAEQHRNMKTMSKKVKQSKVPRASSKERHCNKHQDLEMNYRCPIISCEARFCTQDEAQDHQVQEHYWPCEICWSFKAETEQELLFHIMEGGCANPNQSSVLAFSLRFEEFLKNHKLGSVKIEQPEDTVDCVPSQDCDLQEERAEEPNGIFGLPENFEF